MSVQSQVLNLLKDLKQDMNLTMVFVSHNLAVVRHMATRVAVMYAGEIVEIGPTEQIFSEPAAPLHQALLGSILTPDPFLGLPDVGLGVAPFDPTLVPPGCAFTHAVPWPRRYAARASRPSGQLGPPSPAVTSPESPCRKAAT